MFSFYLAVGATGISYFIHTISQKYINPNKVGIILSLESFLGVLSGVIFLKDSITVNFIIGRICIMIAIFVCEIGKTFELQY